MSRSPWADQSRRSDIRHLRDGFWPRIAHAQTHAGRRTNTIVAHCGPHCRHAHCYWEASQTRTKPRRGPRTRARPQTDCVHTTEGFFFPSPQTFCLARISVILLSACRLDEMTPTLIRLTSRFNCCTCHMRTDWKLRTLLKVTDSGFHLGGGERGSQTCNSPSVRMSMSMLDF